MLTKQVVVQVVRAQSSMQALQHLQVWARLEQHAATAIKRVWFAASQLGLLGFQVCAAQVQEVEVAAPKT